MEAINKPQNAAVIQYEYCNEQHCANCFRQSGCMFEEYLLRSIPEREEAVAINDLDNRSSIEPRRA